MRKVYDMCVKISEYQDNYNKTRARWRNVGSVMEDEKGGRFILLDKFFNFALIDTQGRDNILISLFKPKDDNNSGHNQPVQSMPSEMQGGFNNQPMPSEMQGNWQRGGFNNQPMPSEMQGGFNNSSLDANIPF